MTDEQAEHLIEYVRGLSGAMQSIAKTMELDYQKRYPTPKPARDIEVVKLKTEEDKQREEQGQTGESTLAEWTTLGEEEEMGPRERAFLEEENRRRSKERTAAGAPQGSGHPAA